MVGERCGQLPGRGARKPNPAARVPARRGNPDVRGVARSAKAGTVAGHDRLGRVAGVHRHLHHLAAAVVADDRTAAVVVASVAVGMPLHPFPHDAGFAGAGVGGAGDHRLAAALPAVPAAVRRLGVGRSEEAGDAAERRDQRKNALHEHGESPRRIPARTCPGVGSRCRAGKGRNASRNTTASGKRGRGANAGAPPQSRRWAGFASGSRGGSGRGARSLRGGGPVDTVVGRPPAAGWSRDGESPVAELASACRNTLLVEKGDVDIRYWEG